MVAVDSAGPPPLAPQPRTLERLDGELTVRGGLRLESDPPRSTIGAALSRLERELPGPLTGAAGSAAPLRVQLVSGGPDEGYRLEVREDRVLLLGSSPAGLSHGLSTLTQWLAGRPSSGAIPCVRIRDSPAIARRGVMLDVSRSRVPTMQSLREEIDQLASWKINQLQLYLEHTFAYEGHEEVWQGTSPLTAAEVRELDAYCAERYIELVPNQNSFGHLHRWLELPRYRGLAECPEGIDHPFADRPTPFSLCPIDPGSIELLSDLYAQLLPNFRSRQLHIGFDETMDLGKGRSAERVGALGLAAVYGDFLDRVAALARDSGHRVQLWGDIVAKHPEILERLPEGAIVTDWGYEADHPFEERASVLHAAGVACYVCPGTSSWLSLGGRWGNAVVNLRRAAEAAVAQNAEGLLVTDWGDQGHLQPPVVRIPALMLAASLAWNPRGASEDWISLGLARHAPLSPGQADHLLWMGGLYGRVGGSVFNGSPLFYLLTKPDLGLDQPRFEGLRIDALRQVLTELEERRGAVESHGEIGWVHRALEAAARLGIARLEAGAVESCRDLARGERQRHAERLRALIDSHAELWSRSTRPGGLGESALHLERMADALEGGRGEIAPTEAP